jgi:DNA-binding response OmpR family regulator
MKKRCPRAIEISLGVDASTVCARGFAPGARKVNDLQAHVRIRVSTDGCVRRRCDDHNVRILVVEDEDAIAAPLAEGLRREGFDVERVSTGEAALEASPADLVLLDLRLPDLDGTEVCRRLRARSDVPIIIVTAKGEEVDRVVGLELGADDYVVKPFGFRELLARIRAVMRRSRPEQDGGVLRAGRLEVSPRERRASVAGTLLELTPKEFDLLALLASDAGAVVTRERILREVWHTDWFGPTKTIDVHVASLRKKLGDPRWIETVRGVGHRLAPQP